tara:strand:+ start:266 stop:1333 length:1068 start_codon:yes stop_codon:yes gene_type:complete
MKRKIHLVGGARPNFIKLAPLLIKLDKDNFFKTTFINTGQHYDYMLFDKILSDLNLRSPDVNLNVGSFSGNSQISKIMIRYEKILNKDKPDLILVFGDVNSTLAAALTAKKMGIKLGHVEAGLRCYDDTLPEEVNRRITDSVSDYFFIPSILEEKNLRKENIKKNIFFVGNIMIDSLKVILKKNKLNDKNKKNFGLVTLHRPENVDDFNQLSIIIDILSKIVDSIPLVFSMHPRTYSSLKKFKLLQKIKLIENLKIYNSLGYLDFLTCMRKSKFVISDSGGVQEESSYLGIPCFTLRKNTERPITVIEGTNKIVNSKNLINKIKICERKKVKIDKWDGNTSERIIIILKKLIKDF